MIKHDSSVQRLVNAMEAAFEAKSALCPDLMPSANRMLAGLRSRRAPNNEIYPQRIPACAHFKAALLEARRGPPPIPELANALADLEPLLRWHRRAGAEQSGPEFLHGHANAIIIGGGGIAETDEVRVGVSLVAPGVLYPRHCHAPEELYVVLSSGSWMRDDKPFAFKRSGDLVHNRPNDWHAMRASIVPLLAIWCLWTEIDHH